MDVQKSVVIYGTGIIAKEFLIKKAKDYDINWFVDSNMEKVGGEFEGYKVKGIDSIKNYNGNIIVTPSNYLIEIANYLIALGIRKEKILFCIKLGSGRNNIIDIYPYEKNQILIDENCSLDKYDLLCGQKKHSNKKNILILTTFYSVYTKQLVENLMKRYDDVKICILTSDKDTKKYIEENIIEHVYYFETVRDLKTILFLVPKFDVIVSLWIENIWSVFAEEIRDKAVKLHLCVGGSDFYRSSKSDKEYKKRIIALADSVSAETEETIQAFSKYYNLPGNYMKLLPFGIAVFDYIKKINKADIGKIKEKYGIDDNKIIITCGHNASEAHNHLEMIKEISKLESNVSERIHLVFPMTYPKDKIRYIEVINQALSKLSISYTILTEFMSFEQIAEYAMISDVMIHVQTSDQLSSAMLEEMYAKSVVIAGSWLPYRELHEDGVFFLDVNSVDEIAIVLEEVVNNIYKYKKKCENNPDIIWGKHSWDVLAEKWHLVLQ